MQPPTASLRLIAALSLVLAPGIAHAHITLNDPPARNPADDLKSGPCGLATGDARTTDPEKITTYTAGETITIQFTETVQHDSHYRVQLSSTGNEGFADPTGFEDRELGPNDLYQSEDDPAPGAFMPEEHSIEVTLPDEPCEECTLQLIQVMTDKMPWGPEGGDDIYYQCADIVILPGEGGGTGGAGSGGDTGAGGGSGGTGTGGVLGGGGVTGTGGGLVGAGGSTTVGTGGTGSGGGAPSGAGGGAPSGAGGGGDVPPPPAMGGCSVPAAPVGFGSAGWLGLAGLGWLAARRRRA